LFNADGDWYEYAVTTLFDMEDATRTFAQYDAMLAAQPSGFASTWLGVANCKTAAVTESNCTKFNRFNSLFGESLFSAGDDNTTKCPSATTADLEHQGHLQVCCERCDQQQATPCVLWAAKANVVNAIPVFKASFETGFANFEVDQPDAMSAGLEGSLLRAYNCMEKFKEMPLGGEDV